MQAITISIGKSGIQFFARHFLSGKILQLVDGLSAPNRSINIPDFSYTGAPLSKTFVTNLVVQLSQGFVYDYKPVYQNEVAQSNNGLFTLSFPAGLFDAYYNWSETYNWETDGVSTGPRPLPYHQSGQGNYTSHYIPVFSGMLVTVVLQFTFNAQGGGWQLSVGSTNGQATPDQTNIPSGSVLNYQSEGCSGYHFDQTTAQAIANIPFGPTINNLLEGVLQTIPDSGDLGSGVVYDFSMGDSGIAFPNSDGIQLGVKGGASYNGMAFSGDTQPVLPFPPPLADSDNHHLRLYVSNYELDALHWAYFKAGVLNLLIQPGDLTNRNALNVASYTTFEPALLPFAPFVMYAQILPNTAPVTTCKTAYVFTAGAMNALQQQLPPDVFQRIGKLPSTPFLTQTALETFLNSANVPTADFNTIAQAGSTIAMIVSQDLDFTLLIENGAPTLPYIKFRVQRQDVLTDLKLGRANTGLPCLTNIDFKPSSSAQCLQYAFANVSNSALFLESSITGFDGSTFGDLVWPLIAENNYAAYLSCLGQIGVPLPVMQGFQFDFDNIELSVEEGYVSILTNVLYADSN